MTTRNPVAATRDPAMMDALYRITLFLSTRLKGLHLYPLSVPGKLRVFDPLTSESGTLRVLRGVNI